MLPVSLFLLFKNLQIKSSRTIYFLAKGVFGVYLIHEHPLVRQFLWERLSLNTEYYEKPGLFLCAFFARTTVFPCCEIIEQVRLDFCKKSVWARYTDSVHGSNPKPYSGISRTDSGSDLTWICKRLTANSAR